MQTLNANNARVSVEIGARSFSACADLLSFLAAMHRPTLLLIVDSCTAKTAPGTLRLSGLISRKYFLRILLSVHFRREWADLPRPRLFKRSTSDLRSVRVLF